MLYAIDNALAQIPSKIINFVTLGKKDESLCGRLYESDKDSWMVTVIELVEKDHCRKAYIYMIKARKKSNR